MTTLFGKKEIEPEDTLLNFCLIFRTTLDNFENIKSHLLQSGATLVYQTKSADNIRVTRGDKPHE